jgi:hypothetical protein
MRPTKDGGGDDAYSTPIHRGVSQLQYAHVPRLSAALHDAGLASRTPGQYLSAGAEVFTSILVTTADLWLFRADVALSDVLVAKDLSNIAAEVPSIEYHTRTSYELRKHQQEWLDAIRRNISKPDDPTAAADQDAHWKRLAESVGRLSPSIFIVRFDRLGEFLDVQRSLLVSRLSAIAAEVGSDIGLTSFRPWA